MFQRVDPTSPTQDGGPGVKGLPESQPDEVGNM